MIGEKQRRFVGTAGQRVAPQIRAAIVRLAEAYDYARDMQCDLWEFAVEMDALRAIGLSLDDLRWLVASGYVQHGHEVTKPSDATRQFRPARNLNFSKTTRFVLTDAGLQLTTTESAGIGLRRAA
jgi:hypothetical protein